MRHLASVQRVSDIRPIEGRDRIEQCRINGWNVIIKKGEFDEGDLAVYVEIDSVLPEQPEYEFLRPKKFRIRTMKMAGVLSEGICFPLTVLPAREEPYVLGEDVTSLMGVTKYEPQDAEEKTLAPASPKKTLMERLPLMRFRWYRRLFGSTQKRRGGFPDEVPKTDETRIQNMPFILDDKKTEWVATEKIDGTSATYLLRRHRRFLLPDHFEFVVCSRNMNLAKGNSVYWEIAEKFGIEQMLRNIIAMDDWVAVQGEIIGPKIQGNKYGRTEPDFYAFNLLRPNGGRQSWRRSSSINGQYTLQEYGIKWVPILDCGFILPDTVDEVLQMAHGDSEIGDTLREGIVFRSTDGVRSFKAVDPDFLIHYNI